MRAMRQMLGALTNSFVELNRMRERTRRQTRGKLACRVFDFSFRQAPTSRSLPVRLAESAETSAAKSEHLQGAFARLTPRTHNALRMKAEG